MNYARAEFHSVKGSLFNIVDHLMDSQRFIASTDEYFTGRVKYMTKRIDSVPWKFQLKYSTGVTKRCETDHTDIEAFEENVVAEATSIANHMDEVLELFTHGASKDVHAWNCEKMYPRPQPMDFGPKWLGSVTEYALKGFEVYNMVKKFIPGGSKAGKGAVPGSPAEMELLELADIDWGQVKETSFGLGKKLLDEMKKSENDKKVNMQERLAIWREALHMCNADK